MVLSWLQSKQIALLQVRTIAPQMDKAMKISFVISFLEGTAANRRYTVVAGKRMSATWGVRICDPERVHSF